MLSAENEQGAILALVRELNMQRRKYNLKFNGRTKFRALQENRQGREIWAWLMEGYLRRLPHRGGQV